jgi:trk system potassium uptake protein TrkH
MPDSKLINRPLIFKVLSILLILEALFMVSGLFIAWWYQEPFFPLIISIAVILATAIILRYYSKANENNSIGKREGFLIVTLSWVVISLFGAIPFYISGWIPSFTDASFETISGFTTTGSTILTDIEALPKYLLYWRAMTHWIGGMGIIVLTVAILPFLGIGGMQLLIAEMPGISPDKLHPRITATAKRFWGIYVLFTLMQVLLLWAGEMNFFDAVCHAFATMSTGGFSTKNDSIYSFSTYSQYIIILFMILAGTNFTLHYLALNRKFSEVLKNQEFKVYIGIIVIVTLIITFGLFNDGLDVENSFRNALFTVVSILTTTGFVTVNYLNWHILFWILILALMFIGGSAGSTGGGIKVVRHILLIKNSWTEFKRALHPSAIIPVKLNGKSVPQQIIFNVMAFFLIYVLIFSSGVITMALLGMDFETSVGATIASLGNIGPGIGQVGPVDNYAQISPVGKWVLSFLMLLGRLELFTVLIIFSPSFWRS